MAVNQKYNFQWQNPVLLETIYPFREKKLQDFLSYYEEIELWREMKDAAVDAKLAAGLVREHERLQAQLERAEAEKEKISPALKELQQKQRELRDSDEVRTLTYAMANLKPKLSSLKAKMNTVKGQVEWYAQFAPDHPLFAKHTQNYELAKFEYENKLVELEAIEKEYDAKMDIFDAQTRALNVKSESLTRKIEGATERLAKLPPLDASGGISKMAAVRWLVMKYELKFTYKDQKDLIEAILERFDQVPEKFPMWLRYMVIHFSGMRYQSAHGSWADAKDLLESLKVEELTVKNRATTPEEIDRAAAQALVDKQKQKEIETDNKKLSQIERHINMLESQFNKGRALLEIEIERASQEIDEFSEEEVLDSLKAMKDQFPDWVWKEIVSRTALRLEAKEEDWESLTPEETRERWSWEQRHWRAIMDAWERKDITSWRKEHERTLSLIVSRAVCNEVSEHIHHLRGLVPGAGLTSKPVWYLNNQKASPGKAYLKRPATTTDLKPGASILWLGWVTREPNAWQIAHPLSGVDILPAPAKTTAVNRRGIVKGKKGDTWKYRVEGNKFVRSAQPYITKVVNPPKVKEVKGPVIKEWLRWTHEAIVVDVVEMADGKYVMTFETGQIGVNLRPLSHILNRWDVFVGYIPEGEVDATKLESMLERDMIRLPEVPPVPVEAKPGPELAFGLPLVEEPALAEAESGEVSGVQIVKLWQSLTRREKQVVALICLGNSTREVATRLDTSTSNINSHVSNAMGKFGVKHRASLCAWLAGWDFSSLDLK